MSIQFWLVFIISSLVSDCVQAIIYNKENIIGNLKEVKQRLEFEDHGINSNCSFQLLKLLKLMLDPDSPDIELYRNNIAWKIFDASGKLNDGILTGNVMAMGNYDECIAQSLNDHDGRILGKYCYSGINVPLSLFDKYRKLENVKALKQVVTKKPELYSVSICIPHMCSPEDIVNGIFGLPKELAMDICQTKDDVKELDNLDIAFIVFLVILAICVTASTSYDVYLRKTNTKQFNPVTLAFSLCTNCEKIFKISNNPDQLLCLNGLRVFSILWIMAGHRFAVSRSLPLINFFEYEQWIKNPWSQYVQGAPLAVDTFLFISGTLLSYGFLRQNGKIPNIFVFYLHRYLRLTPALAVLYFFYVSLIKHISSGPYWDMAMQMQSDGCKENWWSFFLYIQNFVNADNICLLHTWYLSMDMQIFIIAPIFLIFFVKKSTYGIVYLITFIVISVIPPIVINYAYDIVMYTPEYDTTYYYMFYNRLSPWLVGLLLGVILMQVKDRKINIHWAVNLITWSVVLSIMTFLVFYTNIIAYEYEPVSSALYIGLHRCIWAIGLMWIVFACLKDYGGFINWILTLPLFQVMARITYSMYLIHFVLITVNLLRKRMPLVWDDYELLNECFGDIIAVSFLGLLWTLLFESPMVVIEKYFFEGNGRKKKDNAISS